MPHVCATAIKASSDDPESDEESLTMAVASCFGDPSSKRLGLSVSFGKHAQH